MGKQEVRSATIALLVSASIIIFASVGCEAPARDDATVSDESTASDEDSALPEWLNTPKAARDVSKSGNRAFGPEHFDVNMSSSDLGYINANSSASYPELAVLLSESEALMDSLSPGVRARYDGALLAEAAAEKRAHEREDAEYAAFIEKRFRRLNSGRSSEQ